MPERVHADIKYLTHRFDAELGRGILAKPSEHVKSIERGHEAFEQYRVEPMNGADGFRDAKCGLQVQVRRNIAYGLTEVQDSDFGLSAFRYNPGQVQRNRRRSAAGFR